MRSTPARFLRLPRRSCLAAIAGLGALTPPPLSAGAGQPTLLAWNNLGMHCMDDDYSVFSILPPYNTLNAQLIDADGNLVLAAGDFTVTYEPAADPAGSINSTAVGRSNFWLHAQALFGVSLADDAGLAGFAMPGAAAVPQPFAFNAGPAWFEATGVPITPWDDSGRYNPYPIMRVVARDAGNQVVASTTPVLPVSEEMDCRKCHGSDSGAAAQPNGGWVNDPVPARDYRLNILRQHDEEHAGSALFEAAFAAGGFSGGGLEAHVVSTGRPILCAACHASEALPGSGYAGVPPLTRAVHGAHATVTAPGSTVPLDSSSNRSACYQCHPGSATRCLRGAMGSAVAADGSAAMQCQSCHGTMSQVASANRTGWLDEPNCQACHNGTATNHRGQIRFTSALLPDGSLRQPASAVFATNPDTPAAGHSLYRFSRGHGGLACSACHGSTHAEYPALHGNDNLVSTAVQGHAGVIADCLACHATMPSAVSGGPHGLHPIAQTWVDEHGDAAENGDCRVCHGLDFRGTVLSRALGDRQYSTEWGTRTFWRGRQIGCYECHDGPDSESATAVAAPAVPAVLTLGSTPRTVAKSATVAIAPASGTTLRIVRQPEHGTVAVSGAQVTYRPDPGYVGPDSFTYAASNGTRESNLGTASVQVELGNPAAVPTSDGLSNVIKYVLGLDPTAVVTSGFPLVKPEDIGAGRFLTLTAVLNPLATNVAVGVEGSSDGVTWSLLTDAALVLNDQPWLLKVRDSVDLAAGATRYLRLVADGLAAPGGLAGRLVNISTRAEVRPGDAIAIAGFVMTGSGTKSLLLRAVGPRLADFGVPGVLANPLLELVRFNADGSATPLESNDDWTSSNAVAIADIGQRVGAFALDGRPAGTDDTRSAALVVDLPPGRYAALGSGAGSTQGIALIEVYDADDADDPAVRLVNLSTRGFVAEGNSVLIGGFVVTGTQARAFLVRGVGPKLVDFHVAGTLEDPRIHVFRRVGDNEELLVSNDDWGTNPNAAQIAATAASVGAFTLDAGSRDAALLLTLSPGIYSIMVAGAPGTEGIAMVELYAVP